MSESWTKLEITVSDLASDAVCTFLLDIGAGGCVLEDINNGLVRVVVYLETEHWSAFQERIETFLRGLKEFFPFIEEPSVDVSPLINENWAIAWQDRFKPIEIGSKLIVAPPWDLPRETKNRLIIIIEPAEAFGTGTHETTQGCLILLEQIVEKIVDQSRSFSVLDIGCGSGILAIAALKLGAFPVTAVDNDPVAVESAKKNAELNGVGESIEIRLSSVLELGQTANVVTANLDFRTLSEVAPKLAELFGEYLIISGVTSSDWAQMKEIFRGAGLHLEKEIVGEEWGAGLFSHAQ